MLHIKVHDAFPQQPQSFLSLHIILRHRLNLLIIPKWNYSLFNMSSTPNIQVHASPAAGSKPLNVLMVGTGEYTTGFVGGGASGSDKKVGVVGLTLFDLRRRGKVGKLSMVGTSGSKFPAIRN
jgi:hypothetical protein